MKRTIRWLSATLLAAGMVLGAGSASAQIKISEIRIDDSSNDSDEYFELMGTPGAGLAGLTYIVIGDASTDPTCGSIECVVDLSAYSLQADGLFCLRNSEYVPLLTGYDDAVPLVFENSDNVTHMLVSGFTGTLGQDLDTNDDGILDVTPWTSVVDCLGLDKGTAPTCVGGELAEERLYCATKIGPDGSFVPSHVYRDGVTQAWTIGQFQPLGATDTPGAPNGAPLFVSMARDPCVPLTGQGATVTAVASRNPTSATLRYRVNGGAENVLDMEVAGSSGDQVTYYTQIPAQAANGTRVEYYCTASNPGTSTSPRQGYFVGTRNIADLRVNDLNGNNLYVPYGARVRGNVTAAYGVFGTTNTDYYVQDATGGLNIFKFGPHAVHPALGDDITVAGSLDQFNGKLELATSGSCAAIQVNINGSGSPPAPLALSLCDLREQHEGLLVRVQDLLINRGSELVFGGNESYHTANCYDDSLEMFIDADTNIDGQPITSNHLEVVGIAGQFDFSVPYSWWYQVQPRSMADLTFLGPTGVPDADAPDGARLWAAAPTPFGRTAEIRYQVPAGAGAARVRLAVFDLRGRVLVTLVDGPVPPGIHVATIDRDALAARGSGIVFCRLEVGGVVLTRKLAMIRQ
jgi:hypothetical protein